MVYTLPYVVVVSIRNFGQSDKAYGKARTSVVPRVHRRCFRQGLKGRKIKPKVVHHYDNPDDPERCFVRLSLQIDLRMPSSTVVTLYTSNVTNTFSVNGLARYCTLTLDCVTCLGSAISCVFQEHTQVR